MADRARYAAMTAERSPCPANESHDIAEIGFRDCRAKRSPSPANECHGTAEVGFRDCRAKRNPSPAEICHMSKFQKVSVKVRLFVRKKLRYVVKGGLMK